MLLKFHLFPFEKDNQDNSNITISFKLVEFSQQKKVTRLNYNYGWTKYVENKRLKYFVTVANPRFKVHTYVTVAKNCMIWYNNKKYIILKNNNK